MINGSHTLQQTHVRAYVILTSLVICGLASSIVTGTKLVHIGINFPFSNIIFSIFTYPIVDCICELWGKKVAQQTMWLALGSQLLIALIIQLSIAAPAAPFWIAQSQYQSVLSATGNVIYASLIAFSLSQLLDIAIYQRIKAFTNGKALWLRSNLSTFLGQAVDSAIFISIVFHYSNNKLNIFIGSVAVKIILSFLMTPVVYLVVILTNWYIGSNSFAFINENTPECELGKSG